jgi:hypothetical protein
MTPAGSNATSDSTYEDPVPPRLTARLTAPGSVSFAIADKPKAASGNKQITNSIGMEFR